MAKSPSRREMQVRQSLAQEAARVMIESGIRDFAAAKRKAAEKLGLQQTRNLPSNQEIEEARADYLRLFQAQSQPRRLHELRETALRAMELLEPFTPRLVGPVLSGTADQHSPVNLHLFTDTPERLAFYLEDRGIPFDQEERRLKVTAERQENFPMVRLIAGDVTVEATLFPVDGLRQAPLSPVDGRPMQRADRREVEALLTAE